MIFAIWLGFALYPLAWSRWGSEEIAAQRKFWHFPARIAARREARRVALEEATFYGGAPMPGYGGAASAGPMSAPRPSAPACVDYDGDGYCDAYYDDEPSIPDASPPECVPSPFGCPGD